MTTEYRDGKVKVSRRRPHDKATSRDTNLTLRGGVTAPAGKATPKQRPAVSMQKNSGQYEAEFKAEEAGSYFITAQATRTVEGAGQGRQGSRGRGRRTASAPA